MNGRMYNPRLHRFVSPDNFIQDPYNTMSYDRQGYVWNNPLMSSDPTGELILTALLIAGLIYGTGNLIAHAIRGDVNNFGDGLKYFAQGFLAGVGKAAVLSVAMTVPILGPAIVKGSILSAKITALSMIAGVGRGIFTGDWSTLENAGKLFLGNFYLDENKTFFGGVWEGVSRHTWQLPQTWLGYNYSQLRNTVTVFGGGGIDRVDFLGGATFATNEFNGTGGVSIGNFININYNNKIKGNFDEFVTQEAPLYMHEYGHYIDSQVFGLSYLFAVGIPSIISANNFEDIEGEPRRVTTHQFRTFEMRANRKAAKYFGKHYGVDWNTTYREGTYETYFPRRDRRKKIKKPEIYLY